MPAWITDTYKGLYSSDDWMIKPEYIEHMQAQQEAKKALAAQHAAQ